MLGMVHKIFIYPSAGDAPYEVEQATALYDCGLKNDRYAKGTGSFSHAKRKTIRQVSFIALEDIEAANEALNEKFTPEETRRNIITTGIDWNKFVGYEFIVGNVKFFVVELCTPCHRPSELSKKPYFKERFQNRGGIRAAVLNNGIITIEDIIKIL